MIRGAIGSLYTAEVPSIVTETLTPIERGTGEKQNYNLLELNIQIINVNKSKGALYLTKTFLSLGMTGNTRPQCNLITSTCEMHPSVHSPLLSVKLSCVPDPSSKMSYGDT